MQLGETIEVIIADLADNGCGVAPTEERVIFVPNAVPGDRLRVKIQEVKPRYAQGKIVEIIVPSPDRVRPHCIVADKCGGCQWQFVSYPLQLEAKRNQVCQALIRIGKFPAHIIHTILQPIVAAENPYHYRNKVTYPLGRDTHGNVKAGYYQQGSHKIINLNQCPVQDERLNPLLTEIKQDIARSGWTIYDEVTHKGNLRHLGFRIGRKTGEILITLVTKEWDLPGIVPMAESWCDRFGGVVGVVLNRNPNPTNVIFGTESKCVAGREYIEEIFAGLCLRLGADTFFQIYAEQAEKLVDILLENLSLQGQEIVVDAYAGIGTLTLPLAQHAKHCYGIEVQPQAVHQAQINADRNHLDRVQFFIGKVETVLPQLSVHPDVVILDPPRKGCDREVIEHLCTTPVGRVAYVSCNPATLARDLQMLCANDRYILKKIFVLDFFPQTAHVESVAFLESRDTLQQPTSHPFN